MVRKDSQFGVEYAMKHRITGAAIIVFVAVVLIPMLLQEPALQVGVDDPPEWVVSEQKIFKSKIEPLNADSAVAESGADSPLDAENADKPALLESDAGSTGALNSTTVLSIDIPPSSQEKIAESDEKADSDLTSIEPATDRQADGDATPGKGWTVRVGTFSKAENVETLSRLLRESGLTARHTRVQTTLGQATRIWLGPYADREQAEEISSRLRTLTGEKGYITRHAS